MEADTNKIDRLNISDNALLNSTFSLALTFLCNITGKDYCTLNGFSLTTLDA